MKKIKAPAELSPEALGEWNAVVSAIEAEGRELKQADVSLLTLYIKHWQTHQTAYAQVKQYGPVIKYSNGVPGQSPSYKVCKETATLLVKMLAELGLSPASRKFDKAAAEPIEEIEITY